MKKSLLSLSLLLAGPALAAPSVTVYKSPTCGCCESWVEHMRESGFEVNSIDTEQMGAVKQKAGVEPRLASCHTAHVDGYVIEGHVPAADVKRLLQQQPEVHGLSIPGMPQSAPGMDIPGTPYEVLSFDEQGNTAVFSHYPG
ncbi:DUF411 domain-containing protein [Oceanimonas baumannii]|uniref:DUF411 domain-containing protein n=1 Tax=Oceanimonas baumannii TaxID=129578 RepID=UPI001D1900BD|nr:DUF411 domain-containing protein [Oceanimonas baumannii]MCC4264374.1 DUF411 domain-containing protein [Oceanimonas baumannii]